MIKHIWFDMSDTLVVMTSEGRKVHDAHKYKVYAEVLGREVNEELKKEFEELFLEKKSVSNLFYSLGKEKNYWAGRLAEVDPLKIYGPNPVINEVLNKLREKLPISLFTNSKPKELLSAVGISMDLFTHVIDADTLPKPKPALDGFYKMIRITGLPPEEIMYVGDHEGKDIIPAKTVGMKTAVVWGKSDNADFECPNFAELLDLLFL